MRQDPTTTNPEASRTRLLLLAIGPLGLDQAICYQRSLAELMYSTPRSASLLRKP